MATLVRPRDADAVDAVARWGRGGELFVEEVDVLGGDRSGPGTAKEALEGAVVVLSHLLIQDDDVGETNRVDLPCHRDWTCGLSKTSIARAVWRVIEPWMRLCLHSSLPI